MLPLIALVVLTCAAAMLVAFGWIGRRVDDHPTCRDCGFDLMGLPAGAPCPECGKAIASERDIRVGNRVRRRGAIALGGSALILAVLLGVPLVVMPAMGRYSGAPTWLLLLEMEYRAGKLRDAAIDELLIRRAAGTLAASDERKLARLAAALHRNPGSPWTPALSSCMNDATLMAMLSQEELDAAAVAGIDTSLKIRPRVRSGEGVAIPVEIWLTGNPRVLGVGTRKFVVYGLRWRIQDASGLVVGEGVIEHKWFSAGLMNIPEASVGSSTIVKCDLEPGVYSIAVEADAVVANSAGVGPSYPRPPQGPRVEVSHRGVFEALPTGAALVEVVESEEMLRRMRDAIEVGPTGTVLQPKPYDSTRVLLGSATIRVDVDWPGLGANAMPKGVESTWRVSLWRADGSEQLSETGAQLRMSDGTTGNTVTFFLRKRVEPGMYLLRFRSDPEAAERTTWIERILGGEMEFVVELTE